MAFLQVEFFSKTLGVASTVNVILPEADMGIGVTAGGREETLPKVLYLLHGYSDDHSIWMRRTSVERYAAEYPLAVVMPAVNHSFYCNEAEGERYWDYVSEELPQVMHKFFRLSDRPEASARFWTSWSKSVCRYSSISITSLESQFCSAFCTKGCAASVSVSRRILCISADVRR